MDITDMTGRPVSARDVADAQDAIRGVSRCFGLSRG
jgi:hypothetical protein